MPENLKRGSVKKVSLWSLPLINTAFKRIAVDIVGPTAPPSNEGRKERRNIYSGAKHRNVRPPC